MNINNLISKGELGKAIDLMLSTCNDEDLKNNILLQAGRYNRNERDNRMGLLTRDAYRMELNRITVAIQSYAGGTSINIPSSYGQSRVPKNEVSDKIDQLKALKKKIRFGFSKELKSDVDEVLDKLLDYESKKRRNDLYDVSQGKLSKLNARFSSIIQTHELELKTKNSRKVANIKTLLNELEDEVNKDNAAKVTRALVAYDTSYSYLNESLQSVTDEELEDFCMQIAETVDSL